MFVSKSPAAYSQSLALYGLRAAIFELRRAQTVFGFARADSPGQPTGERGAYLHRETGSLEFHSCAIDKRHTSLRLGGLATRTGRGVNNGRVRVSLAADGA